MNFYYLFSLARSLHFLNGKEKLLPYKYPNFLTEKDRKVLLVSFFSFIVITNKNDCPLRNKKQSLRKIYQKWIQDFKHEALKLSKHKLFAIHITIKNCLHNRSKENTSEKDVPILCLYFAVNLLISSTFLIKCKKICEK